MNAGARRKWCSGAGRWRFVAAMSVGLCPVVSSAQGGGVTITIELAAESIEQLREWRRGQGLDPPDGSRAACDAASEAVPSRPLSPDAQRRLRRTFVLHDDGVWRPLAPSGTTAMVDCMRSSRGR